MEENQIATYFLRSRLFTYDIMTNFNCNISLWFFKSKFRKHCFYQNNDLCAFKHRNPSLPIFVSKEIFPMQKHDQGPLLHIYLTVTANANIPLLSTSMIFSVHDWAIVIVWLLDLQLLVLSVALSTKVFSWNPAQGEMFSIQHYAIKLARILRFPPLINLTATI